MKTRRKQTFKLVAAIIAILGIAFIGCQPEPEPDNGKNNPPTPPEHTHQWGEWTVTKAPTCTAAGEETRVCALDATHKETQAISALGHDWEWVVTTPATYTAEGVETKTCKHDPSYKDGTRPIPQLTYTAPSIAELGTWLTSQPTNTADTAYRVVLNVNDISDIRTTLNAAPDKYIYLDLSGSTITTIPEYAFNSGSPNFTGITTLVGITIPNSVTSIGLAAFYKCTSLASVTIPNNVTSIVSASFGFCTSLTSITIGSGVTNIGEGSFFGCTSLTEINIDVRNSSYTVENGVLYTKDKTTLHTYPAGKAGTTFIIPSNVTSIGNAAFYGCASLAIITIPAGVTSIGIQTFQDCTNLTSITIPPSVTSIEAQAFYGCTSLTSVTFAGTITSTNFVSGSTVFYGDLRAKFYATNTSNGTPGTYTTTAPVGSSSVWTKQ